MGVVLARLYLVSSFRSRQITARPSAAAKSATAIAGLLERRVFASLYIRAMSGALSASFLSNNKPVSFSQPHRILVYIFRIVIIQDKLIDHLISMFGLQKVSRFSSLYINDKFVYRCRILSLTKTNK